MTTILNKEKILEQARIYVDEGKFDRAIGEYGKILAADPADLRVKLRVAELYTKRKQINEAIKIYREVAQLYSNEGFYLKAVTVLKNILRLNPTLIDVNEMLADLYERMGLTQDAVRQYSILATTLDQKGDMEKTLEVRRKIVDLDKNSETARIKLAEMYQRQGRDDEAVDQYEAIAKFYESEGKTDIRIADIYEKVLARRENIEMLKALCRIYYNANEKKKALKWLEKAKETALNDPELLEMQAKIYLSLNQLETARGKFLALAELEKNNGHIDEALKAYAEILIMMPGEDEKIFKRAEDIRQGAADELKVIMRERRKELIASERQKEEEGRKEEERRMEEERRREEEKLKEKGKLKGQEKRPQLEASEVMEETPKPKAPKTKPARRAAREPKRPEVPPPKPAVPKPLAEAKVAKSLLQPFDKAKEKEAEAAFDLGSVYWRMGLSDEAKAEFEKALSVYDEMVKYGGKEEIRARQRLKEIQSLLKKKQPSQPSPQLEKKAESPIALETKKEPAAKAKEPEEKSAPPKTKKISYV